MKISEKHIAVLREHIRAESKHNLAGLLGGMTSGCFNDVAGVPTPFVGQEQGESPHFWKGHTV